MMCSIQIRCSCFLHLYNKSGAKNGRKMGHITIMEDTLIASNNKAEELFKKLN